MTRAGWCRIALGLAWCIVALGAPRTLFAQVDTLRRDTARVVQPVVVDTPPVVDSMLRDSLRADSLRAEAIRRRAARLADTIKTALVAYPTAPSTEVLRERRWTRDEMMATGAMNLADLLDDVPGITTFRTSWFPGINAAAFQGDFRRLRVFMDGIELDSPDPRNNSVLDLVEISLASLDEVVVERSAGEVRVWLRTWTVTSVTPYTRTDVFTGDLNTNGFRGLFGRRFMNGALFQLTMQQGETARQRGNVGFGGVRGETGDGDLRQITARLGWARGKLSVDGYIATTSRTRDITAAESLAYIVPQYDGSRRDAYVRVGYGSPIRGWSAQALLGTLRTGPKEPETEGDVGGIPGQDEDPEVIVPDSSVSVNQRVLNVGYGWERTRVEAFTRWRTRARALDRPPECSSLQPFNPFPTQLVRCVNDNALAEVAPGFRVSTDRGWLAGSVYGERLALDSSNRIDANLRLTLRNWFSVSLAHSALLPDDTTGRLGEQTLRIEGALRRGRGAVSGGFIRLAFDDGARGLVIPRLLTPYDTSQTPSLPSFTGSGLTFGAETPLYKDIRLQLHGVRWNGGREYRPQTQLRASFILQSEWRNRFPQGHFSINAQLIHEYRSGVAFLDPDRQGTANAFRQTAPYNFGIAMLEIRILRATMFYQFRNVYGTAYAQVAGVQMPPPFQIYGVRWEWFN